MPGDLIRPSERAAIITLKNDEGVAALVPAAQIDPAKEAPEWPFIRLDASLSTLAGRGCTARAEVTFNLHVFAKGRFDAYETPLETPRDHCGRIVDAVVEAIHNHAFYIEDRRYKFTVRSTRSMQDGAERSAWHGIVSVIAKAFNG